MQPTILVVCADEYQTRVVRLSLETAGYQTEGAVLGMEVLSKISQV
jgi:CheY-like chemotaxis protein